MANTPYIDLVKPAGTDKALISVLNANSDKIDSAVGGVQDALAIVCNGNTHGAITSGQFVYVRAHDTLQEGLYTANSNIAANATLSSSNLTANSSGGLNALNEQIEHNVSWATGYFQLNGALSIAANTLTLVQFNTGNVSAYKIRQIMYAGLTDNTAGVIISQAQDAILSNIYQIFITAGNAKEYASGASVYVKYLYEK